MLQDKMSINENVSVRMGCHKRYLFLYMYWKLKYYLSQLGKSYGLHDQSVKTHNMQLTAIYEVGLFSFHSVLFSFVEHVPKG